jgi:MFS superfamily sulfate permease-like transporter
LLASAAGLALVLFSSGMLSARSFASKGGYDIDADREFAAFGAANLASAISQGFAVTGADSRTAVADSAGGRTQVTGLVAAGTIAIVLLFFTGPLQYVPIAALGALLVFASFSLFNTRSLREIWKIDRAEVGLAVITTLGVVAVGAINGILIAVGLALVRFVKLTARPKDEVLGIVDGLRGFHSVERHPSANTFPGLALYRFHGPLTFFNSDYFRQRALAVADAAGPGLQWLVIDAIPISQIDITGLYALRDLRERLEARGTTLILAGRKTELIIWLREAGLYRPEHEHWMFPTLRQALKAFQREAREASPINDA